MTGQIMPLIPSLRKKKTGAVASWTPLSIPSLLSWHDATVGVTGTLPVTSWADQSGNGRTFTSGSGPDSGTRTLNSRNVLDFNGGEWLEYTSSYYLPTGTTSLTMFAVVIFDATTGDYIMHGVGSGASGSRNHYSNFSDIWAMAHGGNDSTAGASATGNSNLVWADINNAQVGWRNGSALTFTSSTINIVGTGPIVFGRNNGGFGFLDGAIAEIAFASGDQTASRTAWDRYVLKKWGF